MVLALDGTGHAAGGGISLGVSLTTANADDVIEVCVLANGGPVVSVTSPNLTFAKIGPSGGSQPFVVEQWRAIAAAPLIGELITVTQTVDTFISIDVFGISGANTTTPGDANASTPAFGPADPLTVSTDAANTFIFGSFRMSSAGTAGPGWIPINEADFLVTEYQIVSVPQTNLSVDLSTGASNGAIADAVVAAGGAPVGGFSPNFISTYGYN